MRQPKPYFKKSHSAWFANIGPNKRPVRLASQEEGEEVAWGKYHTQMGNRQPVTDDCTVATILDRYLEHCQRNRAESTYKERRRNLESFAKFVGNLRLSALKVHHVWDWIDQCHRLVKRTGQDTSTTHRYNLIRAVKTAFQWAEDQEHIDQSPLRKLKKLPKPKRRDVVMLPEQWAQLVALVEKRKGRDGGALLDFMHAMRDTGCRPQEARRVEARHLDRTAKCWVFPAEESKGEEEPRVVPLTDRVFAICERLALKYPKGPLFRNRAGRAWNRDSLHCRFWRLSKVLGFQVSSYVIRHSYATDSIVGGKVDLQTLAVLMGHKSLRMLSQVYQHVGKHGAYMRDAQRRLAGEI